MQHGVSVFCGWASPRPDHGRVPGVQSPNKWPWKVLQTRDRVPALGEYDERDPAVVSQRLRWMQEGGIDYACYQVEWAHEMTQPKTLVAWRPYLDPLLMSHCADHHPAKSPVRFCVSMWDASQSDANYWIELKSRGWKLAEAEASWRQYARTVASRFMARSSYLRVGDRPVLFFGAASSLTFYQRQFGLSPARVIAAVSSEIRSHTGQKPYLVATSSAPEAFPQLKSWGFDAFTEYLLYSDSWRGVTAIYRQRWNEAIAICRQTGIEYWVPATVGYDSTAWGSPVNVRFVPTPAQFTAHLKEARQFARTNAPHTREQVITYAWNEFGEGGMIEPMKQGMLHSGDEMLRAHRAAID